MTEPFKIVKGSGITLTVRAVVKSTGLPYVLKDGEKMVFGLRGMEDDAPLFTIENNTPNDDGLYQFYIPPFRTFELEPGRYFYDVAHATGDLMNQYFYNVVPFSPVEIIPRVVRMEDV